MLCNIRWWRLSIFPSNRSRQDTNWRKWLSGCYKFIPAKKKWKKVFFLLFIWKQQINKSILGRTKKKINPITKLKKKNLSFCVIFEHISWWPGTATLALSGLCIATMADLLVLKHFVDEAGDPIFPQFVPWSTCSPWIGVSVGGRGRRRALGELLTQQVLLMYAAPVLIDSLICVQSACVIKDINLWWPDFN